MELYEESQSCNSSSLNRDGAGDETCSSEVRTFMADEFDKCTMSGCGSVCDGCDILFYHNTIDRDEIFDPTSTDPMVIW